MFPKCSLGTPVGFPRLFQVVYKVKTLFIKMLRYYLSFSLSISYENERIFQSLIMCDNIAVTNNGLYSLVL